MPDNTQLFQWTGMNTQGKRIDGKLMAASLHDAEGILKTRGIEVITIKSLDGSGKHTRFSLRRTPKIKTKNIMFFTRHLSTMISSGLPIIQALDLISQDKENLAMQSLINAIKKNTSEGKTLAESFAQYPEYFSSLYTNLVKSGEKSGTLDKTLLRLANYMQKTETLKKKVKKALVYPAAIMCVAGGVSLILLLFVVPQFQAMFKTFGAQLPFFTRMIVHLSDFLRSYWWVLLILIVGGIWALKRSFRQSEELQLLADKWILKTWLIGNVMQKSIVARFTRTLATTLEAGVPMVESMNAMSKIMGNRIYAKAVLKIRDDVTSGHQLSESMKSSQLFPTIAVQMVSVGEASGRLGEMLHHVADYYEEEVNAVVDNLSSLLEPLIMVILGTIVGGFVIAMYLPIFKMGSLF